MTKFQTPVSGDGGKRFVQNTKLPMSGGGGGGLMTHLPTFVTKFKTEVDKFTDL